MSVYDLGYGCGRTAQALCRAGWQGNYIGADVGEELIDELTRQCPGYDVLLNLTPRIVAPDASLDLVFHWSVFTHLYLGESYLYTADAFRALKPAVKMIFSFLELEELAHDRVWTPIWIICVLSIQPSISTLSCIGTGFAASHATSVLLNRASPMPRR